MELLPPNSIKSINLSLDVDREVPRIVTIGSATKDFFETMDDITIRLDESETFEQWGRE